MHTLPTIKKWVQSQELLIILDEYNSTYRQIFMDGRALPQDPSPTWNGAYVKDQLGHASIKLTVDIYGQWIPGSNRQAVNKLPSLSTPKANAQAAAN